ncbi:MAG: hypothetical protein ACRDDH_20370 [Cetobacterium sp.]|uniref:hypothetical protein n=1 Tax=Cetobacterium sp. TaxID=2071632 RepID=UPI003EE46C6E
MFKKINEEKKKLTFELEPKLANDLKAITKQLGTTQRNFIEIAITKLIDEIKEHKIVQ